MKKSGLFKFILMVFFVVGAGVIINSNPKIVKAADEDYYLVDKNSSYVIENNSSTEVKCEEYSKNESNKYEKLTYGNLDYLLFDSSNKLKSSGVEYASVSIEPGEKVQAGTNSKDNFYLKIPKECKVTKKGVSFWSNYNLSKGKSVKIMNNIGGYIGLFFADKNGESVKYDYRYRGSNNYSSAGHNSNWRREEIFYGHYMTVTAAYEDVVIEIPTYFKETVTEIEHPVFRKLTLPSGKNIVMANNVRWYSDISIAGRCDVIDLRSYQNIGIFTSYEYRKCGCIDSRGILGLYAGYGTDVDIYIPYEDEWNFYYSDDLFCDYTLNPGDTIRIDNNSDSTLEVNLIDAEDKYYYTENDIKTDEVILSSTNPETEDFTSIHDEYVRGVKKGLYIKLRNTSNEAFKLRIPNPYADLVSKCSKENNVEFDEIDLANEAEHYNLTSESEKWNSALDYNNDGICDIYDLSYITSKME